MQKKDAKKPHCNTPLRETGGKRSNGCEHEDVDMGEEMGSIMDSFSPNENVVSGEKYEHVTYKAHMTPPLHKELPKHLLCMLLWTNARRWGHNGRRTMVIL